MSSVQYLVSDFFVFLGGDDKRVLIWKVSSLLNGEHRPIIMTTTHHSNIFSLVFSCNNSYLYSAGK